MKTAFLIGGVKSGSGKTLVTLGLMAALCKRGLSVQPFKCGPDYIDPTLHYLVTGRISSNLDLRMCGESFCRRTFSEKILSAEIGVVEGVMGLFDGGEGSSAMLAKSLALPVILVIDVRSAAESVAAILHGFETYDSDLNIVGAIFNFTGSQRHRELIESEVSKNCTTKVLGFLPRDEKFHIPSRHLGLHMGEELKQQLDISRMAELIESHIDLDSLIDRCQYRNFTFEKKKRRVVEAEDQVGLAVARDEAFCFYYQDNLEMLENAGIKLHYFSPIHDSCLPDNIQGIYFGGGYPEIYAEKLSSNEPLIGQIRDFSRSGGYIYGECGGFMYLCRHIVDENGMAHPMLDLFHTDVKMNKKLRKLGYREVNLSSSCLLGSEGAVCFGHEYHYSEEVNGPGQMSQSLFENNSTVYGGVNGNCAGSYVHLHFARTPEICDNIYEHLLKRKNGDKWLI